MSDKRPKCPNTPKYPCGDCLVCQVPPNTSKTWTVQPDRGELRVFSWPPGFREAWPTREAIAAHQGGVGRWLVTDPYGVKTLGAFDGDTFHVLARWPVVGAMASEPTQPWKFEPYWKDTFTDEINRQRDRRGAPPAATDSPGQPQAPTPPENPAAEPGIAPGGVDAAGFGSWPSEEEIEAHGNGLWLIRQKGDMAPGQIRSMALGRFGKEEGRTVWWSGGRFSNREHMSAWTFCPIDDNGDKLDAVPVLRGEDARQLVEQLGRVAPPEEIARRREESRRKLAENGSRCQPCGHMTAAHNSIAGCRHVKLTDGKMCGCKNGTPLTSAQPTVGLWPSQEAAARAMTGDLERQQDALKALSLRPLTKADRCPRCDEYVVPCPKCPPSGLPKALGREEIDRRLRHGLAKYPVGLAGFENDRIGRIDHAARILSTLPDRSPDRRVLVVLRGLPGSGKSTVAQAIVDSDPSRWARVSKDDIRQMMVGPSGDLFRFVEDRAREVVVAKTADEMAMSALRLGLDVVVDATNLTNKALNSWRITAMVVNRDGRGPVLICERAVPTSVEECVVRDARRGARSVGRAVIERLAATIDVPLEDRNQEVGQ